MLNDREVRALDALDEQAMVNTLSELIAIPSITGSAAESDLLHLLARRLEHLDLEVDLWPIDVAALRTDPDFPGIEVPRDQAWGLVGTSAGDGPVALILQGHVDVVPAGDRAAWSGDPFVPRIIDGAVHGRGACDMKAGVVANLAALGAIRAAGLALPGRVALHLVGGEEDGGLGAFATLRRGHTGSACIITEPTGGWLVTANGGSLTFTLRVHGLATHGSTRYAGVSALDAYLPVHRALAALEARRNRVKDPLMADYPIPAALSVGRLRTGDWASSVPDLLVAEGRLGVRLDEDPAQARREFEECLADIPDRWLREHPVEVEWSGGRFASGRLPLGHPLADRVAGGHRDTTGSEPPRRGAPYGSDLRLYAAAGVPTLHFGPGAVEFAHGPREHVLIDDLVAVARTLVVTILRSVEAGSG